MRKIPEAAVFVAELRLEFRQTFNRDVIIDLYCYRKHGHNEGDEPSFTQPLMYSKIKDRPSVSAVYTDQLVKRGNVTQQEADDLKREFQDLLDEEQVVVRAGPQRKRGTKAFSGIWKGLHLHYTPTVAETGVPLDALKKIADQLTVVPQDFNVHPKLARLLETRRNDFQKEGKIDWAFAELMAFGSLVQEGIFVRLSGQDSGRGTFSQRHSVLTDQKTGERYYSVNSVRPNDNLFSVYDSLLSEAAVLGFEFGYSLDAPNTLVLWEAQFGDFANGAQTIIDQFIVCSESKWQRSCGLVLLLPHGYEGQGPEHSSARLERYLQSCADDNIQVCNLSTPAQYFHALRRQLKRDFRKPLIIMTPKSLLRHKDFVSPVEQLSSGRFAEVLDDLTVKAERVRRVLLCSGKVYYDLIEKRTERKTDDIAIVRLEQLYPFPEALLKQFFGRYKAAKEWVWVQEESQNMGGWSFVEPRLRAMGLPVAYVGRDASASPATGSLKMHKHEQAELVEAALGAAVPHLVGESRNGSKSTTPSMKPQPV